ncbi:MAG: type II toxin-antitoxin system VapC family toxin [Halorhabdus sp.]
MTAFVDTNVLVAAVTTDTDRSDEAIELLNELEDGHTSILNVMELRSVLTKKKRFDQERVDDIETKIARKMTVTFPDASDIVAANQLQSETLLYPMDALIIAVAESTGKPLVSFDTELLEHGAVEPAAFL